MKYAHLTPERQAELKAQHDRRAQQPVVDDALRAAWEIDHYQHSLLLAAATDEEQKKAHRKAMSDIEKALKANPASAKAPAASEPAPAT